MGSGTGPLNNPRHNLQGLKTFLVGALSWRFTPPVGVAIQVVDMLKLRIPAVTRAATHADSIRQARSVCSDASAVSALDQTPRQRGIHSGQVQVREQYVIGAKVAVLRVAALSV